MRVATCRSRLQLLRQVYMQKAAPGPHVLWQPCLFATRTPISLPLQGMGFCGVVVFTIGVPLHMRYRAFFYRERDAQVYSPFAHALAFLVVETLWSALLSLVFCSIFYFFLFRVSGPAFGFFLLGTFICVLCFVYAALAAAAVFPSSIVAQLAGGVFLRHVEISRKPASFAEPTFRPPISLLTA